MSQRERVHKKEETREQLQETNDSLELKKHRVESEPFSHEYLVLESLSMID